MVQNDTAYDMRKAREVFPRLMAYHRWFASARDPQGTGVIGIIHAWESGRDNCPDWDIGMNAITVPGDLIAYKRRDTSHVDSDQRPTQEQYDRFITIVQFARETGWDHRRIHAEGPFLMADPGVQFIFLRATRDLLTLAEMLDMDEAISELRRLIEQVSKGSDWLWNDKVGGYCARDIRTGGSAMPSPMHPCCVSTAMSAHPSRGRAWRLTAAAFWQPVSSACRAGIPNMPILNRAAIGAVPCGRL